MRLARWLLILKFLQRQTGASSEDASTPDIHPAHDDVAGVPHQSEDLISERSAHVTVPG